VLLGSGLTRYECLTDEHSVGLEDDPNDALLLERAFRKAGLLYPLIIVSDGDQAVDFLQGIGKYRDRIKYPNAQSDAIGSEAAPTIRT